MLEELEEVTLPDGTGDGVKRVLVSVDGEITMDSASTFSKALISCDLQPRDEVILLINSPGGVLGAAEFIIDELRGIRHVTGYAYGTCASAAMLLHQTCKRRISSVSTSFMIHGAYMNMETALNVSFAPLYDTLKRKHEAVAKRTLSNVKDEATYKKLKSIMDSNNEHYFSASEAKKYGMVTSVHPQRTLRWETAPEHNLNTGMTNFVVLVTPMSIEETTGKQGKR